MSFQIIELAADQMRGDRFPIASYHATRKIVKITRDKDGELTWIDIQTQKGSVK